MILATLFELLLVGLVILGILNEEKIADFEQELFLKLKRRIKEGKNGKEKEKASSKSAL